MTEPTNAVLAERIIQLERELVAHKKASKEEFREMRDEMKEMERDIVSTKAVANEVNTSMKYVKEAVTEMKQIVYGFTDMIKEHNKGMDTKISSQNEKIDNFINSDKRRDSKRTLIVSVLQVGAGILIAVLGFLVKG